MVHGTTKEENGLLAFVVATYSKIELTQYRDQPAKLLYAACSQDKSVRCSNEQNWDLELFGEQ